MEVIYTSFPDGRFAYLLVEAKREDAHYIWGIIVSSYLRSEGIDITPYVREASDYYPTEASLMAAKARLEKYDR
jgi:hypothetical protein